MDVAAAGFAASQIASIQRGQQAAVSGIKAQQQQQQSVANLLTQAVSAAREVAGTTAAQQAPQAAPQPAPASGGSAGAQPLPSGGVAAPRGSLVNILA
jgi:hypothetical protein